MINVNATKFHQRLEVNKRVSRLNLLLTEERVERLFNTINFINNLSYDEETVDGRNLADWKFPGAFRCFFVPRRVVEITSNYAIDLLEKENLGWDSMKMAGYDEFSETCVMILNALRRDGADTLDSNLKDVRIDALLSSVINETAYQGRVHYDDHTFLPLPITVGVMRSAFYNEDVTFMIDEFVRDWFLKG